MNCIIFYDKKYLRVVIQIIYTGQNWLSENTFYLGKENRLYNRAEPNMSKYAFKKSSINRSENYFERTVRGYILSYP